MVDADSLLDPRALLDVARPFADEPGRVVAAGGVVRVGERLARPARPGDRPPDAARVAGPDPGRGVPARVPHRPGRLVAPRRAADHLGCLRHLPQGRAARGGRPLHGLHRRGRRARRAHPPDPGGPGPRRGRGLRAGAGGLDRGARGPRGAAQAAAALAPWPHRDLRPPPGDDVPSPVRRDRHGDDAVVPALRAAGAGLRGLRAGLLRGAGGGPGRSSTPSCPSGTS